MKLKNARTCNNCRARPYKVIGGKCELGYPVKNSYPKDFSFKPLCKCPKPMTIKDFFNSSRY